jgi:threonylcarbamoyladenosine tRNA methylthiotransferase MtaB
MQYFTEQHHNTLRPVLFEGHSKDGMMEGYTDNYIKVTVPFDVKKVNQIVEWRIG